MVDTLSITLAQLNQVVGDLAGNAAAMLAARDKARGTDLIVFPELQLIGYPPEDLILKPALIERAAAELLTLAEATADGGPEAAHLRRLGCPILQGFLYGRPMPAADFATYIARPFRSASAS